MLKNALYGGVNAAVLSAMRADFSIDIDRMAAHSRWLLANGCNGLGILGTTGEANSIGIDERIEVMEGLVERGIPADIVRELARMGHDIEPAELPHGGGQAIWIDRQRGCLVAGSEPRKDGLALGY